MAGVLGLVWNSRKQLINRSKATQLRTPKVMELQVAIEILAEVFGIGASEVEEMVRQRSEKKELWPERF